MDHTNRSTPRELSDEAVTREAEQLAAYASKPGNRGASFWLSTKGLTPADRAAVLRAWLDAVDGAA
jgi:hypothetical protein